jgi:cytochrome c oxidase subunit 4
MQNNDEGMKPLVTPRTYVLVFIALLALTGATLYLAHVDLGRWHSAVGLTIAGAKAVLIVLFFMHVIHGARLIWVVALSAVAWLSILMVLTLMDFVTRSWLAY